MDPNSSPIGRSDFSPNDSGSFVASAQLRPCTRRKSKSPTSIVVRDSEGVAGVGGVSPKPRNTREMLGAYQLPSFIQITKNTV